MYSDALRSNNRYLGKRKGANRLPSGYEGECRRHEQKARKPGHQLIAPPLPSQSVFLGAIFILRKGNQADV